MNAPLPLHRRARTWYGARTAPAEPLRHEDPERPRKTVRLPALRVAQLAIEIRQAPVDRRLTALL